MFDNYLIPDRINRVDRDFLEFEQRNLSNEDSNLMLELLSQPNREKIKLPNKHNSILLYVTGLSDEFDIKKGRSDTIDGSPPDIDIDFDTLDSDKAVEWVVEKWGRDNVANIIESDQRR